MSAAESIPWEKRAISAEECAALFGLSTRQFLETRACLPTFPARISMRPAYWIAGEVEAWRDANRASPPVRRRSSRSRP